MSRLRPPSIAVVLTGPALAMLLAFAMTGCGGGAALPGAPADGAGDRSLAIGPLVGRYRAAAGAAVRPVTAGGLGAVVTGLAGVQVTSLSAVQGPDLAKTRIAFSRNGQIWAMSPNGSDQTALTAGPKDFEPGWSPDGSKIAFARASSITSQIFVMNANGTAPTALTSGQSDFEPTWSPDGTKIAFGRLDPSTNDSGIFVMNADGSGQKSLTSGGLDTRPSWSPDGAKIAFARLLSNQEIFVMNADGSGQTAITSGPTDMDPGWSPDGRQIAFARSGSQFTQIFVMAVDGSGQKAVTAGGFDTRPSWAPDGTKITFRRQLSLSNSQILVVNADGSAQSALTVGPNDSQPSWSPFILFHPLVGTGGDMGSSASGFLVGQQGQAITSVVTFNATTPSSAVLTAQIANAAGMPNLVFNITADSLTDLRNVNVLHGKPVSVLSGAGPSVTGAIISFDAADGAVSAVLPYGVGASSRVVSRAEGSVLCLQAHFLAAFDGSGKNLAADGASGVRIDGRTGHLLGVTP